MKLSKWQVIALGELQQPGGVGATQDYNPVVDGPNPDGPNIGDNAGNSPEQEVALQTWVNMAVDMLNRGEPHEAIIAKLAHDGCPDPQSALNRAMQQPQNTTPVSDEIGQNPFETPPPQDGQTGQMESLSQQPPTLGRVRVAGTDIEGYKLEEYTGQWGEGVVKIALDDGRTVELSTDQVENADSVGAAHPVSEIEAFIAGLPEVQPTRPHIEARIANLETARRAIRKTISKVKYVDQQKLATLDQQLAFEQADLKEYLTVAYDVDAEKIVKDAAANGFEFNKFQVAPSVSDRPFQGRVKEAAHVWAAEMVDHHYLTIDDALAAAADYAQRQNMTGDQVNHFLSEASTYLADNAHRHVRTEEFTAEPAENEGPADELFV